MVRDAVRQSHRGGGQSLATVMRDSAADTIYAIDAKIDPILEKFCEEWSHETPLVLIAEGLEDHLGNEVTHRTFPHGTPEQAAQIRVIIDPIDGTRGIMYDKRPAWSLAGIAPNKGPNTRLSDIEIAVMTELPTSKMGQADTLWAIKGNGAKAERVDLATGITTPLELTPSRAPTINHGFASIANFFPATKVLASQLMEHITHHLLGPADVTKATVFD
ncbi:MAG: hypothetical protein FWD53_02100, partial [Phycisphaerales bacterium]|nr:hypothetical protein [Phycisphaerales bacterium]